MNKEVSISNPAQQYAFNPENPRALCMPLICISVNFRAFKKQIGLNRDSTFGRESPLYWKRQRSVMAQLYEQIEYLGLEDMLEKEKWCEVFRRLPGVWQVKNGVCSIVAERTRRRRKASTQGSSKLEILSLKVKFSSIRVATQPDQQVMLCIKEIYVYVLCTTLDFLFQSLNL